MLSLKARLVNLMIRNRHLLQGKWRREEFTFKSSIAEFRELCERGAERYSKIPEGIQIRPENIVGLKCAWHIPTNSVKDKLILYVHGGGYVSGSLNDHRAFVANFAKRSGYLTLIYEYRLAPEFPFPAAIEDSLSIYKELLRRGFSSKDILIAGESAGGGLALALLLAIRNESLPLPSAAVAISPWTDLTCSGESYRTKNKVSAAPLNSWFVFGKYYYADQDPRNPLISPLFGELAGLPPLYINSATDDELYDDGREFVERAKAQGVDVQFKAGEGMLHCYPLLAPMFAEAEEAMEEIINFIRSKMEQQQN